MRRRTRRRLQELEAAAAATLGEDEEWIGRAIRCALEMEPVVRCWLLAGGELPANESGRVNRIIQAIYELDANGSVSSASDVTPRAKEAARILATVAVRVRAREYTGEGAPAGERELHAWLTERAGDVGLFVLYWFNSTHVGRGLAWIQPQLRESEGEHDSTGES